MATRANSYLPALIYVLSSLLQRYPAARQRVLSAVGCNSTNTIKVILPSSNSNLHGALFDCAPYYKELQYFYEQPLKDIINLSFF